MAKMIILITARIEEGHRVAERWNQAGAPGVTFIESYGLQRLHEANKDIEILPGTLSMLEILRQSDETSLIVLCVVEDEALIEVLLAETQQILGDLMSPGTGIVFVIDVDRVIGVRKFGNS